MWCLNFIVGMFCAILAIWYALEDKWGFAIFEVLLALINFVCMFYVI